MTESEFIAIHNPSVLGNINFPLQINVNIESNLPQQGFSLVAQAQEFITGLTVTINAKFVDTIQNVPIKNVLQQVERIRFTFDEKPYNLKVISRNFFLNQDPNFAVPGTIDQITGHAMFYYRVIPFKMPKFYPSNLLPKIEQNVIIDFSPFLTDLQYALDDYNPTLHNIIDQRRSEVILECNRVKRQEVPDNFLPIISGSALRATIPDSNYSTIGWKTSRYEGSKSNPDNYSGVSPSLTGRSFIGEIFPEGSSDNVICSTLGTSRVYEELLHTGKTTIPTFATSSIGPPLQNILPGNILTLATTPPITGSIDTGDILILGNNTSEEEKVRVIRLTTSGIEVQRGYAGTQQATHNPGTAIDRVQRVDIFRFGGTDTRISSAVKSAIYVKDTEEILYTDEFGTVFTGSMCT